jgi:SAM-dependent methyltransferase
MAFTSERIWRDLIKSLSTDSLNDSVFLIVLQKQREAAVDTAPCRTRHGRAMWTWNPPCIYPQHRPRMSCFTERTGNMIRKLLLLDDHTCPWWLAYSWDHRLRMLIHDPAKIIGPHVKEGDRVLDIGCGMGYFSLAMAGLVGERGKVYSLDIQQKMLDVLMKRAKRRGADRPITPILGDGTHFSIPEPLDFILAFWMLHEVDDKAGFLKSLHAALKTNGAFLLVEPKVHTSGRVFRDEVDLCLKTGFRLEGSPVVGLSRAGLLRK